MIKETLKKIFKYNPKEENERFELNDCTEIRYDVRNEKSVENSYVSDDIEINSSYIRNRYRLNLNNDVIFRTFEISGGVKCFLVYYEGMVVTQYIDDNIIKSMIELSKQKKDNEKYDENTFRKYMTHAQAKTAREMDIIVDDVNFGACAVFVDGAECAFVFDVRGWEHRSINKPENEQSIYGPQEAFSEMLRTNTALVRKIIKSEKLVALGITVGNVSKTKGVLLYIDDIANDKLVDEVKRRLDAISTDYIVSVEEVQMFIEDKSFLVTPQILGTERPDRAARALTEGRCVLILNGSPRALIMPSNVFELTHVVSDDYLNVPYALMSRIIRFIGMFLSLLLPALYLAITLYHQEIIPTYLLYSISASRENVPFPSLVEVLLMDISFELIREAGIRMPSPIGSTLGIVGGLILGQAAVSAKMVSPIMIIVIAITGIGSFATADYSLGWSYRLLRLVFILLAASFGFFGIAVGISLYSLYIGSIECFGIPFLSPSFSISDKKQSTAVGINKIWKREKRPGYMKTKANDAEPRISKRWYTKNKMDGNE